MQVKQGFEPINFTSHFFGWNNDLWKKDSSYETYRQSLEGKGAVTDVATVCMFYLGFCMGVSGCGCGCV